MGQEPSEAGKAEDGYRHPDSVTDAALDWFMRLQDAPEDRTLRAEFERWRRSDPQCEEAYARLERMHSLPSLHRATERHAATRAVTAGPEPSGRNRTAVRGWTGRIAAIAAALVLAIGLWQAPYLWLLWHADYITAAGEIERLTLPDGSKMILNTASAVALDFTEEHREVLLLSGEAYFDVFDHARSPFVVRAGYSETEDFGTAFSVRRNGGEDTVVLRSGRVEVRSLADRADSAGLQPAQRVSASEHSLSAVSDADMAQSFAWLDGRIIFRNALFSEALDQLGRYHAGRIFVADSRLNKVFVSGNYSIGDAEAAVRTLTAAAGGSVTALPGGILILR